MQDFNLCPSCQENDGHPHHMEKLDFNLDEGSSSENVKQMNAEETRKFMTKRCIMEFAHACRCKDSSCRLPNCQKMKKVVSHINTCSRRTKGGCPICIQLVALCCHHARQCQETQCDVPFCSKIKHKLKQQPPQTRLEQIELLQKRAHIMQQLR